MARRTVLPIIALLATSVCTVVACAPSQMQVASTPSSNREAQGWLGVDIATVTDPDGALVADVVTDSPADTGGIENGDVIVRYDGHPVRENSDLPPLVANTRVGTRVAIDVVRDGRTRTLTVKIVKHGEPGESAPSLSDKSTDWWGEVTPAEVQALLDQGADLHARDHSEEWSSGRTPLHKAALRGNLAVVALLLERGADLHARDTGVRGEYSGKIIGGGNTPLHFAVIYNTPDIVTLLLERGADLHARDNGGETVLHNAVSGEKGPSLAPLLLERGADIAARDNEGETVLHKVVDSSNIGSHDNSALMLPLLLERGASVHINTRDNEGQTPLHYAANHTDPAEVADAAALLLDAGADTNARTSRGRTPLHAAAGGLMHSQRRGPSYNYAAIVTLLLERGADLDARDENGMTPLHAAARVRNFFNVAYLLDRNAKIKAQGKGWNFTVRQAERGADINARDNNGETPLHHATRQFFLDGDDDENSAQELAATVRVLLMAGADASIRNAAGKRPIDIAAENEHFQGTEAYWQLNDAGYETRGETGALADQSDPFRRTSPRHTQSDRQPSPPTMGQQREQREVGGGDLAAQLRQTEATCGRPYRGPTDRREHSRFHCMYAYFLQCNKLVAQHRTVCAQYEAMRANGAPPCPHC